MDRPDGEAVELLRAALFAARVHATHRRKGASAEPSVNHVLKVAQILAEHGAPREAVLAGLLHDTVEDSAGDPEPITEARLAAEFGAAVAAIVAEVTDDKALPNPRRPARPCRCAMRPTRPTRRGSSSWPTRSPTCARSPPARRRVGATHGG
jgi:(p)ppGpp synthase/HD superfamily hydrolase